MLYNKTKYYPPLIKPKTIAVSNHVKVKLNEQKKRRKKFQINLKRRDPPSDGTSEEQD